VQAQSTLGFFGMTSENSKIGMTGLTGGHSRVGAAEGCDLLILFLQSRSKDRSLRQLLQGNQRRKKTGQSLGRFFMLRV